MYYAPVVPDARSATASRPGGSDPVVCYRYSGPTGGKFGIADVLARRQPARLPEGDGIHVADVPDFARRLHARRRDAGPAAR